MEELGPNALKVHQVASCHSLWGFWKVPFPTDESPRGWRFPPSFLHRRISDDNSYFLILPFCQLALYKRIIRIFNRQVWLATIWRQFQMLNAGSGPGFRVRVRVCFVFTSWLLCYRLLLVGGGEDDHIRSAQVSGKFEMQPTCKLMFVVNLCCDLYFLVCEIARSKLTSFVSWGSDWSRDDEETVRGLVPFWDSFLVLN